MNKEITKIEFCGSINVSENLLENHFHSDLSYSYLSLLPLLLLFVYINWSECFKCLY